MNALGVFGALRRPVMGAIMKNRVFLLGCAVLLMSVETSAAAAEPAACSSDHLNRASLQNVAVLQVGPPPTSSDSRAEIAGALQKGDSATALKILTESATAGVPSGGKVLGYTRLRIDFIECADKQLRDYNKETRGMIERFLVGKADNHVLKFDAQVEPVGVKTSSQLYSMLRNNSKDGQTWTTDVRNGDFLLPYFRIDTASILNFTANFQSEGTSDVDVATATLDIIERGAKLIAPTAAVITDTNKERFNSAATFVDDSLSKLFYKKVTETARQGVAIRPTAASEHLLVRIVLFAPHPTKTFITPLNQARPIGEWNIYAEKLRKSLFVDDVDGAVQADVSTLDPATVLNLKIDDKQVLRDRLASSEAIGKAAQLLAKATAGQAAEPAISLCRLVAAEAAKVGLAPYDLAIAAWAFLADQAMETTKHDAASAACKAVRHYPAGRS